MSKVENTTEAVAESLANQLEHVVKTEKVRYVRSTYGWSTQYGKEKYEEQRTVALPEETSDDAAYAYQLLTTADLCHMVIFNAYTQGKMEEEEFLEILGATKSVMKKALPYMKVEKENKSEIYDDMVSIYKRLKTELKENGLD